MVTSIFKKKGGPPISKLNHFYVSPSKFFLAFLLTGRNEACAFLKMELCRTGQERKAPTSPEFLHLIITKLNLRFIQARDVKTPRSATPATQVPDVCAWAAGERPLSGWRGSHGSQLEPGDPGKTSRCRRGSRGSLPAG